MKFPHFGKGRRTGKEGKIPSYLRAVLSELTARESVPSCIKCGKGRSFGIEMLAESALVKKRTTTMLAFNPRSRLFELPHNEQCWTSEENFRHSKEAHGN